MRGKNGPHWLEKFGKDMTVSAWSDRRTIVSLAGSVLGESLSQVRIDRNGGMGELSPNF
jgi:hypothetical protein